MNVVFLLIFLTCCFNNSKISRKIASYEIKKVIDPISSTDDLQDPQVEMVKRLKKAKIVIADYDLIKRDFPQMQGKRAMIKLMSGF